MKSVEEDEEVVGAVGSSSFLLLRSYCSAASEAEVERRSKGDGEEEMVVDLGVDGSRSIGAR